MEINQFIELKGNLVYLKKLDKEYSEAYWQGINNCSFEATIFTGTGQVFNRTDIEGYIEEVAQDKSRVDFLIFSNADNRMIGDVVLLDIARNYRSAGIRIAINNREDLGKGYGTEAIILALNYGFGMLNLHRIGLDVLPYNERAIHVYEKIGFRKEGIIRDGSFFNHKYHDLITMSILEDEFRSLHIK